MRIALLVLALVIAGCGTVVQNVAQGGACSTGAQCATGTCADGVCCDRACDAGCEACTMAKTGNADGTCAPVRATTDPDGECTNGGAASCGANGTGCNGSATAPACNLYPAATTCGSVCTNGGVVAGECDGAGACIAGAGAPTSCGSYSCDAGGTSCLTSCTGPSDCTGGAVCTTGGVCVRPLRVALEAGMGSCARTESLPLLKAALDARGDTATIVDGTMIDSAAKLANFDVVVIGAAAACTNTDYPTFDAALGPWVNGGGGVVGTGWTVYIMIPPNIAAMMPVSGMAFLSGVATMTPVGTHPIVTGILPFASAPSYTPYGGAAKAGSTQLLRDNGNLAMGEAWPVGAGRTVFLGPIYIDSYANYMNQALTDGSNPQALNLLIRAIEWAGRKIN